MSNESVPPVVAAAAIEEVRQRLWPFMTLVFRGPETTGVPEHMGTGTFVATGGRRYLLTAAHVWRAIGNRDLYLGLRPEKPPLCVPRVTVSATAHSPSGDPMDGPDLAFICIPDVHASQLAIDKAFYDLDRRAATPPPVPPDPYWSVAGAPGISVAPRLNMRLTFFGSRRVSTHESGGFDYIDVSVDRTDGMDLPFSFAGVSGSGLWQLHLVCSEDRYEVGDPILSGVAFYESFDTAARKTGIIRCHGMRSIYDHRP